VFCPDKPLRLRGISKCSIGWPLALPTNIRMSGTNTVVFVRNVSDGGRKFYENDTRTSCRVDSELAIEANDVSLESRSRWVNDKTSFMTSPRDPVNLLLIKLPIITSLLYLFGKLRQQTRSILFVFAPAKMPRLRLMLSLAHPPTPKP